MSVAEKIRRLRQMSAPEVRFRAAQRWRIQRERWGGEVLSPELWLTAWDPKRVPNRLLSEHIAAGDEAAAAALLPHYFSVRRPSYFFFDPQKRSEIIAAHREAFPQRLTTLLAEADAVCQHRFRIFAYPEVNAGPRIPWRRDMVHGKEAPDAHWSRVPYLDFSVAGDSKIVWEPNRHQHFVTLGQAYFLTGDEKYSEECFAQWEEWLATNPRGRGINWASSLELAFRVWSWVWALHLLQGSAALTGARWGRFTHAIGEHCAFIRDNLSAYFSPNTHLLGEGFALFVAGLMFPELRGAAQWLATGRRVLSEEIERQVRADGWHAEQSSYYHRYAVDFFHSAAILAERNGCPFPASYTEKLARMCDVILHSQLPGGFQPMLGDADGGRLLPFSTAPLPYASHDQRGVLSNAAVFFGRNYFRMAAGTLAEETFWLYGPEALQRFGALVPLAPSAEMRVFANAGLVAMRSSWDGDARVLLFDAGPQGMPGSAHGHADALQILCSGAGHDWLVDPGTYAYTSSREWRQAFAGTRAHNTVTVDGLDQAEAVDFFKWKDVPEVKLEHCFTSASFDVAVGSHNGYGRLAQGVTHRRRVVFAKPQYWVLTDELTGSGKHSAEFYFHFSPGTRVALDGSRCTATRGSKSFLLACSGPGMETRIIEGDESARMGWYSADYGHREPAPVLVARLNFADSAAVHWLLWPEAPSGCSVRRDGYAIEVAWPGGAATFLHDAGLRRPAASFSSDAQFAFCQRDGAGKVERVAMFRGCCLDADGAPLLRAESMVDAFEVHRKNVATLNVMARPARRLRFFAPGARDVRCNGGDAALTRDGDWLEIGGN